MFLTRNRLFCGDPDNIMTIFCWHHTSAYSLITLIQHGFSTAILRRERGIFLIIANERKKCYAEDVRRVDDSIESSESNHFKRQKVPNPFLISKFRIIISDCHFRNKSLFLACPESLRRLQFECKKKTTDETEGKWRQFITLILH